MKLDPKTSVLMIIAAAFLSFLVSVGISLPPTFRLAQDSKTFEGFVLYLVATKEPKKSGTRISRGSGQTCGYLA